MASADLTPSEVISSISKGIFLALCVFLLFGPGVCVVVVAISVVDV